MELYFPAPLLMQYIPTFTVAELKTLSREDAIRLYKAFNKSNEEDVESRFYLPPNYKALFLNIRNSLRGKYLGKDVRLFFSMRRDVTIPEITLEELEDYFIIDTGALKELKLRKAKIIERMLITDILFRTFYQVYDEIKSELKELSDLQTRIQYLPLRKALRLNLINEEFFAYSDKSSPIKVHYPNELRGFKASCFPLLAWSQLMAFGIQNIVINHADDFNLDPPSDFVEDCRYNFDIAFEAYKNRLKSYIAVVSELFEWVEDSLERYLISCLPKSPIEIFSIFDSAKYLGYDPDEARHKFVEMCKRGIVYFDPKDSMYKTKT